jgi:hypothetical protein
VFFQYLVNYEDATMGHGLLNSGRVGQVTDQDGLLAGIELRALTQVLKQLSVIEQTSITCRAQFGDERCKMTFVWRSAIVTAVGAEPDRMFTIAWCDDITDVAILTGDDATTTAALKDADGNDITENYKVLSVAIDGDETDGWTDDGAGTLTLTEAPAQDAVVTWTGVVQNTGSDGGYPGGFKVPGVVNWTDGESEATENEIESLDDSDNIVLVIPTWTSISVGDVLRVRRDCDKSKAMCKEYDNLGNMRAEPELPRANGLDLQAPTPSGSSNEDTPSGVVGAPA